jgi:hypothetical protein
LKWGTKALRDLIFSPPINAQAVHMKKNKLKFFLQITLGLLITIPAWAQVVAACGNVEGYAYYHYAGSVSKKDSGFTKDKITGGMTTIQKMPDGTFDILVVDSRKRIISMVQDGGKVLLLRRGEKDATFMLYFPNNSIDIYSLWIDAEGQKKYDLLSSRGGDSTAVHKSSVMSGLCTELNLNNLPN